MLGKLKFTSFEDASILRKLTILYFLISIVPVGVLYYLYIQFRDKGQLLITEEFFALTLFFVVLGVGIGYVAMRSLFSRVVQITQKNKATLESLFGPQGATQIIGDDSNEIEVLTHSFNEITSRLEDNVRNLQKAKKTLRSVLARVGEGISSMDNIDSFLNLILETVTNALQCECGILFLSGHDGSDLYVKDICGKALAGKKPLRLAIDHELFASALASKRPVVLTEIPDDITDREVFQAPMLCAPLFLHDAVSGVICVCGNRDGEPFQEEEKDLLYNLALQTAIAVENSKLNDDAEKTYFETISALALAVEARDPYSRGHSERVANYCMQITGEMNVSHEDVNLLRDAAKLHDIGKIGITDEILKKDGSLNDEEIAVMHKHVDIGEGIIKPVRSLKGLCDIVRHHHEKLDGSGYPDGLKGEEVHPLVRILTVADIFDALTSNRPYREPFTFQQAIEQLRDMKGEVDQKIVDVLSRIVC